jgi:predicted porin
MKFNRTKLAILIIVMAGSAHAQSSVTLYGIIDEGVNYISNAGGHTLYNMSSSVLSGSRWGLKGAEDLGDGLKAIFTLENGFDLGTGGFQQGGDEFGRQAFVGISSTRWGSVTLGRQYDSVGDFVGPLIAAQQWLGNMGGHAGDIDNMGWSSRANNSVKFTSINYRGLTIGGLYGFGGTSGDFSHKQIWSIGGRYIHGPLTLAAGYFNARDPNQSFYGNNANAPAGNLAMTNPIYSGYASANTQQTIGVGGAYTLGKATAGVVYSHIRFSGLGSVANGPTRLASGRLVSGGSGTFNNVEVNFRYQLTPDVLLGTAYDYTNEHGIGDADYHQVSAGVDYLLSVRTTVYLVGAFQRAIGANSQGVAAIANIHPLSASNDGTQGIVRVGIRHLF